MAEVSAGTLRQATENGSAITGTAGEGIGRKIWAPTPSAGGAFLCAVCYTATMINFVGNDLAPPPCLTAIGYRPDTTAQLVAWGTRVREQATFTRREVRTAIAAAETICERSRLILAEFAAG